MTVTIDGAERPPAGCPVHVQLRDISFEDAAARTIAAGQAQSGTDHDLATVQLEVGQLGDANTVWAHVDVDGDGRVSKGDYITMQSYPLSPRQTAMRVAVRKV